VIGWAAFTRTVPTRGLRVREGFIIEELLDVL
jgi:hypothetical protein